MNDVAIPSELLERVRPQMIMELAAKMQEPEEIIARYGVSKADFREIATDPMFQSAYRELRAFWTSDANLKQRIAVKAGVMVEESLLRVYQDILMDKETNKSIRMDAFKTLAAMSDTDGKKGKEGDGSGAGGKMKITFNIGGNKTELTGEAPQQVEVISEQ